MSNIQVRSLETLGENKYIILVVKTKLPDEFNQKLEELREGNWTLTKLRKNICKLVQLNPVKSYPG